MTVRRLTLRVLVVLACCTALLPVRELGAQQVETLRVYLARHGQTDGNLKRMAQGWIDTPLNATGREHAAMLAERLRGVALDAIYSSTLSRSRQTAEAVAAGRSLTVQSLAGLREIGLGRFENVALDDPIMKTRPPADKRGPEDGESGTQIEARVGEAVAAIKKTHASGTVLIVGHAGANGYVMRALLGVTAEEMAVFKFIPAGKFNEL